MSHFVFVYGTLKKGFGNHRLLEKSRFIRKAEIPGTMYNLGAFPGIRPSDSSSLVAGEIYEVDDPTLDRLDTLEGHPNFYVRRTVDIPGLTHWGKQAWVYYINPEYITGRSPMAEGVWNG